MELSYGTVAPGRCWPTASRAPTLGYFPLSVQGDSVSAFVRLRLNKLASRHSWNSRKAPATLCRVRYLIQLPSPPAPLPSDRRGWRRTLPDRGGDGVVQMRSQPGCEHHAEASFAAGHAVVGFGGFFELIDFLHPAQNPPEQCSVGRPA